MKANKQTKQLKVKTLLAIKDSISKSAKKNNESFKPENYLPEDKKRPTLLIENFLPSLRTPRQEELKLEIIEHLYRLDVGQSVFIPKSRLHVGTIRKIVLPELTKKAFLNTEIRIVVNKKTELEGCRIARYL